MENQGTPPGPHSQAAQ
ncbi:hypothetical protein E2C01_073681 [Portunus trituberculatus]|uniref:Uncharacterized protein n=1 Tax=Portunus trituberculatus TaxID=210409 RepID=A0A5B7IE65_PORTR|nr:hypothetical protein [Portunus trituberculatus]